MAAPNFVTWRLFVPSAFIDFSMARLSFPKAAVIAHFRFGFRMKEE